MAFRSQITSVATWVGYDEPPSLASGKPALINAVIAPTAGTESGHIQSLNPRSAAAPKA